MSASQNGHAEVVKILLEKGAQVDLQNSKVFLKTASLTKPIEITQLVHHDSHDVSLNFSPLNCLPVNNEPVSILLQNGSQVNIDIVSDIVSDQKRQDEIIKILLQHSAKKCRPESQNIFENKFVTSDRVKILEVQASDMFTSNILSALLLAALKGHNEIVSSLLDHGAKIDLTTDNGWTPLMFASQNGHEEVVCTLLSKGAQVNLKNKQNQTALMLAEEAKEYNVMYFGGTLISSSLIPPVSLSDKLTSPAPPPVSLSDKLTSSTPSPISMGSLSRDTITCPVCEEIIPDTKHS